MSSSRSRSRVGAPTVVEMCSCEQGSSESSRYTSAVGACPSSPYIHLSLTSVIIHLSAGISPFFTCHSDRFQSLHNILRSHVQEQLR